MPNEAESVRAVALAAYAKYVPLLDRPPAPMLADYHSAVRAGSVWVIGDPVAALLVLEEIEDSLLVKNIAVHPASQGRGLGRTLMDLAEREARARGFTRLSLYTNEVMSENVAMYQHLGFREVDRRTEDGYRRVFMEKELTE